jgi:predicted DsbA family dithiol-disulfide isomerase
LAFNANNFNPKRCVREDLFFQFMRVPYGLSAFFGHNLPENRSPEKWKGRLMTEPAQITVDIVSDVVCPWCYVGYKQLERAAGMLEGRAEINVRWHPFELGPDTPQEGKLLADYSRERYGATPEQGKGTRARIQQAGEPLGIAFNYAEDSRIWNTHRAHQLLAWAGEVGKQTALKLALFRANFTDQRNVAEEDVLLDCAEAAELDREAAREVLESGRFAAEVDAEIAHWQDQNITGVPAMIVNGKFMIPGAQDAATLVQIIERVMEREAV